MARKQMNVSMPTEWLHELERLAYGTPVKKTVRHRSAFVCALAAMCAVFLKCFTA
jgi:hypothetical protein